jgi:hypothetical protein
MLVLSAPATSYAITPTDVFRAVTEAQAEVRLLHDANFSSADAGLQVIKPENRRPRHVLQLARTVLRKANQLAFINGGVTVSEPAMPNREVLPEDVLAVVQTTMRQVRSLKPVFGVQATAQASSPSGTKSPNDVYAALYELSQMIDRLGIPVVVPNDVHQIAATIKSELALIAKAYDAPVPQSFSPSAAKTPKDVYARAFELFDAFGRLTAAHPELTPPGGLTIPYRQDGAIKPAHVAYALNDLLAEVGAMKIAGGDATPVRPVTMKGGMTPAHVYDRLSEALAVVEALSNHVQIKELDPHA